MTNKVCGIYLISNNTGEQYVGKSINIHGRWRDHAKRFPTPEWSYEILCECKSEELDDNEIKYVRESGSHWTNPGGLNKTVGGSGFSGPHSPETRAKIAAARKGKPAHNKGRKHSPESIANMSAAKKGKKASPETKAKMSATRRGKKHSPESIAKMSATRKGRKGKPMSEEQKQKLSAAIKGKPQSPETKELRRLNREKKKCLK